MMRRFGWLVIALGAVLILCAGGMWLSDAVEGYEVGEQAEEILNEVWAEAQPKLGLTDAGDAGTDRIQTLTGDEAAESDATAQASTERVLEDKYAGILEIPSLGLTLCVYDGWNYPLLRSSPCLFMGDGQRAPDRMVVCGHNYPRHFGRLTKLNVGDQVLYMNGYGEVFTLEVVEQLVIDPDDFASLEAGKWDIALVTCTIGGRRRVVIKCEEVAA